MRCAFVGKQVPAGFQALVDNEAVFSRRIAIDSAIKPASNYNSLVDASYRVHLVLFDPAIPLPKSASRSDVYALSIWPIADLEEAHATNF